MPLNITTVGDVEKQHAGWGWVAILKLSGLP